VVDTKVIELMSSQRKK